MSQLLLILLDLKKPFEVHCDASGDFLGAVLLQEGHPIAYESRCLHTTEHSLGIYEKELLAMMHALGSWKHYLMEIGFVIHTDHQSIKYFMTWKNLFKKQMRWANFLSQFHFYMILFFATSYHISNALDSILFLLAREDYHQE